MLCADQDGFPGDLVARVLRDVPLVVKQEETEARAEVSSYRLDILALNLLSRHFDRIWLQQRGRRTNVEINGRPQAGGMIEDVAMRSPAGGHGRDAISAREVTWEIQC